VTSMVQCRPRSVAMQQISVIRSCGSLLFHYAYYGSGQCGLLCDSPSSPLNLSSP
jgi:hypothetical protein